jgi:hypothetical protein
MNMVERGALRNNAEVALCPVLPLNHAVTQATIGRTICKPGWTNAFRFPFRVTDKIKRDKLRAAGWTDGVTIIAAKT